MKDINVACMLGYIVHFNVSGSDLFIYIFDIRHMRPDVSSFTNTLKHH